MRLNSDGDAVSVESAGELPPPPTTKSLPIIAAPAPEPRIPVDTDGDEKELDRVVVVPTFRALWVRTYGVVATCGKNDGESGG